MIAGMELIDAMLVAGAGVVAGVVNAMAGGGSLLTVGLLNVFVGLPGLVANGTNRFGVLVQNASSVVSYRKEGVRGFRRAIAVIFPVTIGSFIGSLLVSSITDETFERIFGILMVPLLFVSLRPPKSSGSQINWHPALTTVIFFAIGLYGGAFQAGVGLLVVVALSKAGLDLVNANAVKVVVIFILTAIALPVFIVRGQVDWGFAVVLAVGFAIGGWIGARIAVRGGEKIIRPVLVAAVAALAGRMIGLY
ncbi:MAG: integrase [Acidimicrobiaceae bacterium]|nr:integrase [Acidimicrobiaceae bacterium]|tara:strand:+ start:10556 stop:11305 length:750 start_codon:yes stop_codon:yes gene_type:complete